MKQVDVTLMQSFVDDGIGGNAAGVVLQADGLTHDQKLAVAARVGVSETAFLSPSTVATCKLEFFTPVRQIPHCGHATVATFCLLSQNGTLADGKYTKETIDGIREIRISSGSAAMQQNAPTYTSPNEHGITMLEVAASLRIRQPAEWDLHPPLAVHTGNRFLIIPVPDLDSLRDIQPDFQEVERISEALVAIGFYCFTLQTHLPGRTACTRMFAPRYGIPEESATGTAAGPLAGYLYDQMKLPGTSHQLEQGRDMQIPSPSLLNTDLILEQGAIQHILVGGKAMVSKQMIVTVE